MSSCAEMAEHLWGALLDQYSLTYVTNLVEGKACIPGPKTLNLTTQSMVEK